MPTAPIHHEGGAHEIHRPSEPPDDATLAALVARVRASVTRATSAALDDLAAALPQPITSLSVRGRPADLPDDITVLRRVPYESRADSVMYCQVLAELALAHGWEAHRYDAKEVEARAAAILGDQAHQVLTARGPRSARRGPRTTARPSPRPSCVTPADPGPAYPDGRSWSRTGAPTARRKRRTARPVDANRHFDDGNLILRLGHQLHHRYRAAPADRLDALGLLAVGDGMLAELDRHGSLIRFLHRIAASARAHW